MEAFSGVYPRDSKTQMLFCQRTEMVPSAAECPARWDRSRPRLDFTISPLCMITKTGARSNRNIALEGTCLEGRLEDGVYDN